MPDTPEFLSERLLAEGYKVEAFFRGLLNEQWEATVYTEGAAWNARQVLAHITSAEISIGTLIQNIRAGGPGAPEDFRLDEYNERKVHELDELDVEETIQRFIAARQGTAQIVAGLSTPDLQLRGRHPFLGDAALVDIIKMVYLHNQLHLRDLRRVMAP